MQNKTIRVRFAPSPTGYLHVGGLRTALYNYLFAKKNNGKIILRIEDTDRKRLVEGATEELIKVFNKVGIEFDEGPTIDKEGEITSEEGDLGPYIQSERKKVYSDFAHQLVKKGKAYRCWCDKKRIHEMRKSQEVKKEIPKYDGLCRNLEADEIKNNLQDKKPYTIRLKVPKDGTTKFEDRIYGKISYKNINLDDQVILKSDGFPTYHLANTVDDHLMKISHVIRGEEWLPSTPKHVLIYNAFSWKLPEFVHLPLLLEKDKSKISKRKSHVSVEYYLKQGYLPEAILNFILLLGWNPKNEKEYYTLDEMIKDFTLDKINKSGAVFNLEKLDSINSHYIKEMDPEKLSMKCLPFLEKKKYIVKNKDGYEIVMSGRLIEKKTYLEIIALEKERISRLSDVGDDLGCIFNDKLKYSADMLIWKKMDKEVLSVSLNISYEALKKLSDDNFNKEEIEKILFISIDQGKKIKVGELLWPLRVSLTGEEKSPSPFEIAEILGKKETLRRIKEAQKKTKSI